MKLRHALVVFTPLLALVAGCGGGGGGSAPAYDLSGWWEMAYRAAGSGDPYRPLYVVPITQHGAIVDMGDTQMTLEGSRMVAWIPDASSPTRTEYDLAIVSPDLVVGFVTNYEPPDPVGRGEISLRRVPTPTGTFSANGRVMGQPVNMVSTHAYASIAVRTDPTSPQYQVALVAIETGAFTQINITFDQMTPVGPGTYHVTSGATRFDGGISHDELYGAADTGSVTFTRIGGGRVAGSYSFDLNTGGTVSGTFDVDVYISRSS